jgi:GT2 family glycosyltransferase
MKLDLNDITFIIVTYQSENIVKNCLDSLPKDSKKIIVENSNNINLEKDLRAKYDNIEVIISKNVGMGAGNNIGLKACKTKYAYVLNPDTKLNKDTMKNLIDTLNQVSDFTLASPLNDNQNIPNYKKADLEKNISKNILSVESIDGFSMLFNLNKFPDQNFFDENFFLYLENDDLCLRVKQKNEFVYVVKNSLINHKGGIATSENLEYLRNWHWSWSKFYYSKKHKGYIYALMQGLPKYLSSMVKYLFYFIINKKYKSKTYYNRALGFYNAMIGKSSWNRPKID